MVTWLNTTYPPHCSPWRRSAWPATIWGLLRDRLAGPQQRLQHTRTRHVICTIAAEKVRACTFAGIPSNWAAQHCFTVNAKCSADRLGADAVPDAVSLKPSGSRLLLQGGLHMGARQPPRSLLFCSLDSRPAGCGVCGGAAARPCRGGNVICAPPRDINTQKSRTSPRNLVCLVLRRNPKRLPACHRLRSTAHRRFPPRESH